MAIRWHNVKPAPANKSLVKAGNWQAGRLRQVVPVGLAALEGWVTALAARPEEWATGAEEWEARAVLQRPALAVAAPTGSADAICPAVAREIAVRSAAAIGDSMAPPRAVTAIVVLPASDRAVVSTAAAVAALVAAAAALAVAVAGASAAEEAEADDVAEEDVAGDRPTIIEREIAGAPI